MEISTIIQIVVGIGGLSGLFVALTTRKKIAAEVKNIDADVASKAWNLASSALEEVGELEDKLDTYKESLEESNEKAKQALLLVEKLQETLVKYKAQLEEVRGENKRLRDGINRLIGQMLERGITPVWKPGDKE